MFTALVYKPKNRVKVLKNRWFGQSSSDTWNCLKVWCCVFIDVWEEDLWLQLLVFNVEHQQHLKLLLPELVLHLDQTGWSADGRPASSTVFFHFRGNILKQIKRAHNDPFFKWAHADSALQMESGCSRCLCGGCFTRVCVCGGAGGALPSCVFMWPDVYLSTWGGGLGYDQIWINIKSSRKESDRGGPMS